MAAVHLETPTVTDEEAYLAALHGYDEALRHRLETPRDGSDVSREASLEVFRMNYTVVCAAAKLGYDWCHCKQQTKLARERWRKMSAVRRARMSWEERAALEHVPTCNRRLHVWHYYETTHEEDFKHFTNAVGRSGTGSPTAGIGFILAWAGRNGWPELDISAAIADLPECPAGIPPIMAIASGEKAWRGLFSSLPRGWGIVVELVETTIRGGNHGHDASRRDAVGIRAVPR